jgi:hypothetical protein
MVALAGVGRKERAMQLRMVEALPERVGAYFRERRVRRFWLYVSSWGASWDCEVLN